MAEEWINNDSARDMTRKFNRAVRELNQTSATVLGINTEYVTAARSGFSIVDEPAEDEPEVDSDGN